MQTSQRDTTRVERALSHRFVTIDGINIFYREAALRELQPQTLIVWGPQDGYMPEGSARAYLRDLPNAELHLVEGGHWALETSLDEIVVLVR
jgi:pimeloyl-ACP methyl ester carboxylesterase